MARAGAEARRIVLVDDSSEVRTLVRIGLEATGSFVVVAEGADGGEAVALAASFQPDAVVLDLAMPVMDGLQALPELRLHCPSAPVVVLSGFDDTMEDRCLAAGAAAYVIKDGDISKIVAALDGLGLGAERPSARRADPARPGPSSLVIAPRPPADRPGVREAFVAWTPGSLLTSAASLAALCVIAAFLLLTPDPGTAGALAVLLALPAALLAARMGTAAGAVLAVAASSVLLADHFAGRRPLTTSTTIVAIGLSVVRVLGVAVLRRRSRNAAAAREASMFAVVGTSRTLATTVESVQATNRDLEAANADLRQFGFVVSHDLAEPLRTMAGFSRLLATSTTVELDPTGREYLAQIQGGAARMQRLIDDLRAYTMAGQQDLDAVPVPLEAVVADVRRSLDATIAERHGRVVSTALPTVLGDHSLLVLVLQNLISNGLKFNQSETPTVTLSASWSGSDNWRIDVSDNGIGFRPDDTERAFALFVRLQPRDAYPGTGLGLAICKRIVERHGGAIAIRPGRAGGTTVSITLPAAEGRSVLQPETAWSTAGRP